MRALLIQWRELIEEAVGGKRALRRAAFDLAAASVIGLNMVALAAIWLAGTP